MSRKGREPAEPARRRRPKGEEDRSEKPSWIRSRAARTAGIAALLALVCAGSVSYKISLFHTLPFLDPADGRGFFWTESGFHYRHFAMVAAGDPIPPIDRGIQYPEGLDTVRSITPIMERVTGTLHRALFSKVPHHLFLPHFSFVFSTFSVVAIFLAGRILWRSTLAGLLCALYYAFAPASVIRTAGGGFIREDFALPFIFFGFACFLACLREDRPLIATIGSILIVIALASWHVSQLYVSAFMLGLAVVYFAFRGEGLPRRSIRILVAFVAGAALLLPPLRATCFITSPSAMLAHGILIADAIAARGGRTTRVRFAAGGSIIIAFLAASFAIQRWLGVYSHVFEVILAKIRFLGVLPDDPSRLSFEARTMWTSAFVSPGWIEIAMMLGFGLLFGVLGAARTIVRLVRRRAGTPELMAVYFAACTFVLFLLIHRMSIFAVFFLVLSAGALVAIPKSLPRYAMAGCLGVCFLIQSSILGSLRIQAFRPDQRDLNGLLSFLETHADRDAPVLTTFQLGPSVAAYAGHPVILHPKFETKLLRDKVGEVYRTLFQGEESFHAVCERFGARLVVYEPGIALSGERGGFRYMAAAGPLRTDSAAFLFHFAPERLSHFSLAFQNHSFRVFEIGAPRGSAPAFGYDPIYDPHVFIGDENPGEYIPDERLAAGLALLARADTHRHLGDRFRAIGEWRKAAIEYERARSLDRRSPDLPCKLGEVLFQQGRLDEAKSAFLAAISLDRDAFRAHEGLGKIFAAQGEMRKAAACVERSLAINPSQPHLTQIATLLRKEIEGRAITRAE